MRIRSKIIIGALAALLFATPAHAKSVLFSEDFSSYGRNSIIASEYDFQNGSGGSAPWMATSGCLFERDGRRSTGWVGDPHSLAGDASPQCTPNGSTVFRLVTRRADFRNVSVSFGLFLRTNDSNGSPFLATSSTPALPWDGVKIFLRYQDSTRLYYASVARRDGGVVIKKKCPGGPDAGGTYYDVGDEVYGRGLPADVWQKVEASAVNLGDGVRITLSQNGQTLITATDNGVGCAPIREPGRTGIRSDNVNFQFDEFTVTSA
jgi:hypothetical protein